MISKQGLHERHPFLFQEGDHIFTLCKVEKLKQALNIIKVYCTFKKEIENV